MDRSGLGESDDGLRCEFQRRSEAAGDLLARLRRDYECTAVCCRRRAGSGHVIEQLVAGRLWKGLQKAPRKHGLEAYYDILAKSATRSNDRVKGICKSRNCLSSF